jgi:hypothetical protein
LDIVEGSVPSETEKEATSSLRVRNMGPLSILGTSDRTNL